MIDEKILDRLTSEQRYEFEERAAIMQFDGKMSKDKAENLAFNDFYRQLLQRRKSMAS